MNHDDLNHWSKWAADWITRYHQDMPDRPVRPALNPGKVIDQLPPTPPMEAVDPSVIVEDFQRIVPDAMTHWQHPRFFAYFPANAAPASMLAEQLANGIAAQCMLWQTSPAATEMEIVMVDWMRQALGLADHFRGTIQDSATTATLSAVLTMRERALDWSCNTKGLFGQPRLRVYCSDQTHSSIDKAVRIAGIGQDNLVRIQTDASLSMTPQALEAAINHDVAAGFKPAGLILSIGGTSVGGTDKLPALIAVAKTYDLYVHVDAAWAGSAMICPEFRPIWAGVDGAHSVVMNPHKWLGAQFDCSIQFLADPEPQVRTLGLRPDYLQTLETGDVTDFNEWTVPLGRRFRALKLWFLFRAYGLDGLRGRIRNHVNWAHELCEHIRAKRGFEITSEPMLSLFSFHFHDDARTEALLKRINDDGRVYLTQTRHNGKFVIRVSVGQFDCTREDVMMISQVLDELAD